MSMFRKTTAGMLKAFSNALARDIGPESVRARTLVFAPHPDDEVLGCGGTILKKSESGAEVHVVFMTDGAASHAGRIPAHELVGVRRAEAHEAIGILGLDADHVTFLDFPDHDLAAHRPQAVERVRQLIASFGPQEVLAPHSADRLSDHVETYEVVAEALNGHTHPVRILEYPVWLWHTWPWTAGTPLRGETAVRKLLALLHDIWRLAGGCRARMDIGSVRQRKQDALRAYRSQTERRDGDPGWPVLADVSNGEFLACFDGASERFRTSWHRP